MALRSSAEYQKISRALIKVLRGKRSQLGTSKRLGFSTNTIYTWEAGSSFPVASSFFQMAVVTGVPVDTNLRRFFRETPGDISAKRLAEGPDVALLLRALLGTMKVSALARASNLKRLTLARWLRGDSQPRLPELLSFVEHTSLRLLDFVEVFVDPGRLSTLHDDWQRLQKARTIGYEHPMTHAVLRAIEVADYRSNPHRHGSIAAAIGITRKEELVCLRRLADSGQIEWDGERWVATTASMVDFRRNPERALVLKSFWASTASKRVSAGPLSAYNVFAVSREDLKSIEQLQREYLGRVRQVVASSEPPSVPTSLRHPKLA